MSSSNIDVRPPPVPPKSRDNSTEQQQQRYGASAYIDQSEYDAYKQSSSQINKNDGGNRGAYSNYSTDNNNRYVEDIDDDNDYPSTQHYTKNSSTTSYSGLINRSNSYNGLQPRVISAKQRNTSGSSLLYQVKNFKKNFFSK